MSRIFYSLPRLCLLSWLMSGMVLADAPSSSVPNAPVLREIGVVSGGGINLWKGIRDNQQRLWTAFYPIRHSLSITPPTGNPTPLNLEPDSAPSGLALAADDAGRIWIAYRNKMPTRGLFVTRSDALGTAYLLSADSLPLARALLESDGTGGVYALWYDEQHQPDSAQSYWLYFNHLDKDGKASVPQRILPGIYPLWIHDQDGTLAVFSWYGDTQGSRVAMRRITADGVFGSEIEVARTPPISPPLGTFTSGARWFVYWEAQYGELRNEFLIEGAYSDDHGATWKSFNLPALRGLDVRGIEAATDGHGRIALAITGRHPQAHQEPAKHTAYLVTSNDHGNTWNAPQPLQPAQARYSEAPTAKVAFIGTEKTYLLVAVEDWRTFRPAIRYSLSKDNGAHWEIADQPLPLDSHTGYLLSYTDSTIYPLGDDLTFLLERTNDAFSQRTLVSYPTHLEDLLKTPAPVVTPDPERLKLRVNAYGKALMEKNYQAAYDLFDPFYHAQVDFFDHLKNQGRIVYTTAEYADAEIQGYLAKVTFHIVASVPKFKGSEEQNVEVPVRDVIIPLRWIWIDGDWSLEYYSEAKDLRYTHY